MRFPRADGRSSRASIFARGAGAAFFRLPRFCRRHLGTRQGAGQESAEKLCTNCHLVGSAQQQQPANADVPSFKEIADREDQTAGAITARIMLPKHPMPQIPLTKAELADLAAYILSLRDGDKP